MSALAIVACKDDVAKKEEAPKDYVTLSGKITNKSSDSIVVRNREFSKTIKVNAKHIIVNPKAKKWRPIPC